MQKNYHKERTLLLEVVKALYVMPKNSYTVNEIEAYLRKNLKLTKTDLQSLNHGKERFKNILDHVFSRKNTKGKAEIISLGLVIQEKVNKIQHYTITQKAIDLVENDVDSLYKLVFTNTRGSNISDKNGKNHTIKDMCVKLVYEYKTHKMLTVKQLNAEYKHIKEVLTCKIKYNEQEALDLALHLMYDVKIA